MNGPRAALAVVASVLLHLGIASGLRARPVQNRVVPERRAFEVRMLPLPPEPEPAPPAPEEPERVQPAPPVLEPAPPKPAEPPPAPSEAPSEPAPLPEADTPLALLDSSIQAAVSGVATSTALETGGGISRVGARAPTPRDRARPAPPAPPFTALADLSRKPRPPSLDALLRKHYPEALRRRGVEGQATVRAHLSPRGRVALVEVLSESAAGFADACRRTLLGSEWTEPLDRDGNRVATQLTYRCKFQIER